LSTILHGELVSIVPCTNELWHEFHRNYEPDPMMDTTPYTYDEKRCENEFIITAIIITH